VKTESILWPSASRGSRREQAKTKLREKKEPAAEKV